MPDDDRVSLRNIPQVVLTGIPLDHSNGRAYHPQTEVCGVEVDTKLAPLLALLWDIELITQFSCQGEPIHNRIMPDQGLAYIVFGRLAHAYRFLKITSRGFFENEDNQHGMSIKLNPMTDRRGAVTFPPALLPRITQIWADR